MKVFLFTICFVLLVLVICSCNSGKKEIVNRTDGYSLKVITDKCMALDSETTQDMECLQLFYEDSCLMFSFTNEYDNSIVLYNYNTGKHVRKIKFDKEGANGIGSLFAYLYINRDSIYLYNRTTALLFLMNEKGIVKQKKEIHVNRKLEGESIFVAPDLFPRTNSPMRKIGHELLLSGLFFGELDGENSTNRPVIMYYDLGKDTYRYSDSYPFIYHKGNWGGGFSYRCPYYTFSSNEELVISFAADPHIRVHSVREGGYKEFYAGIKEDRVIKPVEQEIDLKNFTQEKQRTHFINNLNYGSIHYDSYRKVYYRIAQLPNGDLKFSDAVLRKPIVVLILDEAFNIVGESLLPKDNYLLNQCFVAPDGFHIQVESEDDDVLRFKTFQLIKL